MLGCIIILVFVLFFERCYINKGFILRSCFLLFVYWIDDSKSDLCLEMRMKESGDGVHIFSKRVKDSDNASLLPISLVTGGSVEE